MIIVRQWLVNIIILCCCVDDGKFFKVDLHREKNRINKKTKSEKCGGKGVGEKSRGGGERWRWVEGNGN